MIKIFTSRFKSMFPWLLVMPWCRSKILDQSLSRHHACLVGTGHNKGKEKKKPFSLGNEKKNLRGKSFFYSRWEYCSIIFHTRNFATIKEKLFFFILKILLFVLVRYKNLMKRAKKTYPTSCRHAKKVSPLTYSRMIRLRFCEPRSPCVRTFGIRTTLFFCLYVSKR